MSATNAAGTAQTHPPTQNRIVDGAARLRNYAANGAWLAPNNIYFSNCISEIDNGNIVEADLCEYVAASAVMHCIDGYSYLGRSIQSLLSADSYTATHLAYYAELRAAMAILASDGIGVFNHVHYSIDSNGTATRAPNRPGTHEHARTQLDAYSQDPKNSYMLLDSIKTNRFTASELLTEFGNGYSDPSLVAKWLDRWSKDLLRLSDDHKLRVQASYRPRQIPGGRPIGAQEAWKFVHHIWKLLEPNKLATFETIDSYLIRDGLESSFKIASGKDPSEDINDFENRLRLALSNIGLGPTEVPRWTSFFIRSEPMTREDPWVLQLAVRSDDGTVQDHLAVICRATLLLRMTVGAVSTLLTSAGFGESDVDVWRNAEAQRIGLTSTNLSGDEFVDLFADVRDILDDLEDWDLRYGTTASQSDWLREKGNLVPILGGAERIILWGII